MRIALACLLLGMSAAPARVVAGATGAVQRLFIVGDSTASHYGPERAPRTGWGQVFGDYFDASVEVHNHAQSGRSARSFIEQGHLAPLMHGLASGDVLLIQFGHNDEKIDDSTRYNEPREAFPQWLMKYIELARRRGATPVLVTPVARRLFVDGELVETHGLYADAVRTLATREGIDLIDLGARSMRLIGALGDAASKRYFMHDPLTGPDNTHFNRHGANAIACLVAASLVELRPALSAHTRRDIACGAEAVAAGAQVHPAIVEQDVDLAADQPGPHGGAGTTTAYNFFLGARDLDMVFRKRVLHTGASIGPHRNDKDEIFYVISGAGLALVDGAEHPLRAGSALLSRRGGIHAIQQVGTADLVLIICYQPLPSARRP